MNNKLIISTFLLFLSLAVMSQDVVVSAEGAFTNKSVELNNLIEIYPNPATEYLIVEIGNSTLNDAVFEMRSIIGNKIQIRPVELGNGRFRIPVKNFTTGYYFVVVKDEEARFKKAFRFLKN